MQHVDVVMKNYQNAAVNWEGFPVIVNFWQQLYATQNCRNWL